MGDLGISVKLDDDDKDDNLPKYAGKGATPGFVTVKYANSIKNAEDISKNDMWLNDRFALYKTFDKACKAVEHLLEEGEP